MTKEEAVYAATLNLIGSDVPDPVREPDLAGVLDRLHARAETSAARHVVCPGCPREFVYDGPVSGEHFAEMWDHMIVSHGIRPQAAALPVQHAWERPLPGRATAATA